MNETRRQRAWVSAILPAVMGIGCASVINGSTQTVEIRTTPPGATAEILPGGQEVRTPAEAELPRKQVHTVRLQLEGYCRETAYLDRVHSHVIWGNLLIGGLSTWTAVPHSR